MGSRRVQLKRIENKISRQVTFSKRRTGLLKKAKEITVLCDADVGLIVFSSKGKLFDFSNDSCMESILHRYERYGSAERNVVPVESETRGSWSMEHTRLTARIEVLQKNIGNLAGDGLDPLNLKELQYLEQQLDNALRRISNRKNKAMHQSIADLRKKEKCLQDQNSLLTKTVHGNEKDLTEQQMDWDNHHHYQQQQNLAEPSNLTSAAMLPEPLPHLSLTIGSSYHASESVDENRTTHTRLDENSTTHTRPVMTSMPSWMLSNFNG